MKAKYRILGSQFFKNELFGGGRGKISPLSNEDLRLASIQADRQNVVDMYMYMSCRHSEAVRMRKSFSSFYSFLPSLSLLFCCFFRLSPHKTEVKRNKSLSSRASESAGLPSGRPQERSDHLLLNPPRLREAGWIWSAGRRRKNRHRPSLPR